MVLGGLLDLILDVFTLVLGFPLPLVVGPLAMGSLIYKVEPSESELKYQIKYLIFSRSLLIGIQLHNG